MDKISEKKNTESCIHDVYQSIAYFKKFSIFDNLMWIKMPTPNQTKLNSLNDTLAPNTTMNKKRKNQTTTKHSDTVLMIG